MKKPLVSVIMPAYNVEHYIEEAISSVLNQSFDDFELIIVNDGSTDDTGKIIKEFAENDGRIVFIDKENEGVSVARNTAMEKAQGEYLAFLDSDDYWHEDFLNVMVTEAKKNPQAGWIYTRCEIFYPDGKRYEEIKTISGTLTDDKLLRTNEFRFPEGLMSSTLIRRDILRKYGLIFPVGISIAEDLFFFLKLFCVAEALTVSGTYSNYRRREGSASQITRPVEKMANVMRGYITIVDFCRQNAPEKIPVIEKVISYEVYRFIYSLLKDGKHEVVEYYIDEFRGWLEKFTQRGGRLRDRLKCRAILWGLIR